MSSGIGIVVRIRVSPRDCMTVADLAASSQLMVQGMSFSSAVSTVFSALCQAAREMGAAPERDGFEFTEMMKLFSGTDHKKKLDITNAVTSAGSEFRVRAVNMPLAPALRRFAEGAKGSSTTHGTPAMRRAQARVNEMAAKREAAPDSWTAVDDKEFEIQIAIAAGEVVPPEPA